MNEEMRQKKENRKKLISAASMLAVATLMLAIVTYAWFTLSTNPEISNMTVNMDANQSLEIALDAGYVSADNVDLASQNEEAQGSQGSTYKNPYTWGNTINLSEAFVSGNAISNNYIAGSTLSGNLVLTPVAYAASSNEALANSSNNCVSLNAPQYGGDGRISSFGTLSTNKVSAYAAKGLSANQINWVEGERTYNGVTAYCTSANAANYSAFGVAFWIRSNQDCEVGLDQYVSHNSVAYGVSSDVAVLSGNGSFLAVSFNNPENPSASQNIAVSSDGTVSYSTINRYLQNLTIRFDVVSENGATLERTLYAVVSRNGAGEDGIKDPETISDDNASDVQGWSRYDLFFSDQDNRNSTGATTSIHLNKNEAKKIVMTVYLDGAQITNKDSLIGSIEGIKMNLQFNSSMIINSGEDASNGTMPATAESGKESR